MLMGTSASITQSMKLLTGLLSPIILFSLTVLVSHTVHGGGFVSELPLSAKKILEKHKIPQRSLSLYVKEIGAIQPLLAINTDIPRNPASSIKLITSYAGLKLLGPAYTWQTKFYLDGTLTKGTLHGNLVMEGGGDPFLVTEDFWHMLFMLQAKGLKHIQGDLLIDASRFESETGSPADFDNKPYRAYNAFPSAVLVNFRAHRFNFEPQRDSVNIYADPPAATLKINNRVRLSGGRCRGRRHSIKKTVHTTVNNTTITFSGSYPRACGHRSMLYAVLTDEQYVYGVFKSLWESMGGTLSGTGTTLNHEHHLKKPFHVAISKPLREIITHINKHSNNVMARQLLLTIGKEKQSVKVGTKAAGQQAIKDWLLSIDIPAPELVLDNGAGLSRKVRVSVNTLGQLLEHAYHSVYWPEFLSSLPMSGVDGTMERRLEGAIPLASVRVKTGLLKGVRSMAGYVRSREGQEYIVVLLHNHPSIQHGVGTLLQDEILEWLYYY